MQEMKIDTEAEAAIIIIKIGTSHQGKDLDLKTISGLMEMPMISLGSYFFVFKQFPHFCGGALGRKDFQGPGISGICSN